jgi:mono/diheme cytochrome c family protein
MTARFNLSAACSAILSSLLLLSIIAFAQKIEPSPESISKGEAIYKKNCQMCHGATGMGDGPAGKRLNPKPSNFQDKEKMASQTDEHLFKHITKGEGPMPAFERKLKEDERWMVLHYIRTFAK